MGLFWALYASMSAGFLAGAAIYLWRWKKPPEVIVKTETKVVQKPQEIRYVNTGPKIVRCKQCLYFKMKWMQGDHCEPLGPVQWCALHDRQVCLEAFCSSGEKEE